MSLFRTLVAGPPPRRQGAVGAGDFALAGGFTGGGSNDPPTTVGAAIAVVQFIARTCAMLPRKIVRRGDRTREEVRTEEFRHIWGRPNGANSGISFWETKFASIEGWGNGYTWKGRQERVRFDERAPWRGVEELWHLRPQRVQVGTTPDGLKGFALDQKRDAPFTTREIGHVPGLSYDGVRGVSPVRAGASAHELSWFAERFGTLFFKNGTNLSGVLLSEAAHDPQAAKEIAELWDRTQTGASNWHKIAVIGGNAKYERIGIPPNEAQFIETRLHQREEVLQFYGAIPHHLLGWRSNTSNFGTGIENQGIHLVTFVLLNRLRRVEQWVDDELLPPDLQLRFNVKGLLEGDMKTRSEFLRKMREAGVLSADQWLATEDMAPRGIPDDYLYQGNMIRIAAAGGETLGQSAGRRQLAAGAVSEARCPECSSLLGKNITSADLWCDKCRAERSFVAGRLASGPALLEAPRDPQDWVDALAEEIAERL